MKNWITFLIHPEIFEHLAKFFIINFNIIIPKWWSFFGKHYLDTTLYILLGIDRRLNTKQIPGCEFERNESCKRTENWKNRLYLGNVQDTLFAQWLKEYKEIKYFGKIIGWLNTKLKKGNFLQCHELSLADVYFKFRLILAN